MMIRARYGIVLGAALCAVGAASVGLCAQSYSSSGAPVKVYKWVDDKGVLHYGDSVPPEYSQTESSVLNSQGVEVGHVEGHKNATQQAEQAHADEQARQQAQHDKFLLSTYVSAKDIEQLRDERLEQVDAQIKASMIYIDSLTGRLQGLVDRAMKFRPYSNDPSAHRLPDDLAEDLVRTANESRVQHLALDTKRKAQSDMRAQFEADIRRYRELTARVHS